MKTVLMGLALATLATSANAVDIEFTSVNPGSHYPEYIESGVRFYAKELLAPANNNPNSYSNIDINGGGSITGWTELQMTLAQEGTFDFFGFEYGWHRTNPFNVIGTLRMTVDMLNKPSETVYFNFNTTGVRSTSFTFTDVTMVRFQEAIINYGHETDRGPAVYDNISVGNFVYRDLPDPVDPNTGGPAGVPEPSTWALMIAGFGLAGYTLRARKALTA